MPRIVIIEGPIPRATSRLDVPLAFLEKANDLERCTLTVGLQAAVLHHKEQRIHYKTLMVKTGYGRAAVVKAVNKLRELRILVGRGGGIYSFRPGRSVKAFFWELERLKGCSGEQVRVWVFVKLHEGIHALVGELADQIGIRRQALARALYDRGSDGLVSLELIHRRDGCWFTPTGLPDDDTGSSSTDLDPRARVHTRVDISSSPSSSQNLFLFRSTRSPVHPRVTLSLLSRGVQRGRHKGVLERGFQQKVANCKTVDETRLAEELPMVIRTVAGHTERLLRTCRWTAQIGLGAIRKLLDTLRGPSPKILFRSITNALQWVSKNRPGYNRPIGFLLKWCRGRRNLETAARQVKKPLRWPARVQEREAFEQIERRAIKTMKLFQSGRTIHEIWPAAQALGYESIGLAYDGLWLIAKYVLRRRERGIMAIHTILDLLRAAKRRWSYTIDDLALGLLAIPHSVGRAILQELR